MSTSCAALQRGTPAEGIFYKTHLRFYYLCWHHGLWCLPDILHEPQGLTAATGHASPPPLRSLLLHQQPWKGKGGAGRACSREGKREKRWGLGLQKSTWQRDLARADILQAGDESTERRARSVLTERVARFSQGKHIFDTSSKALP